MHYRDAISYLLNQLPMYQRIGPAAYKSGLENTHRLDDYFNHPHRQFHTIHVAGTNGKGSVSHMLASVLQQSGYRVGLYTSPHLLDFRERIKVNGDPISKDAVSEFVMNNRSFFDTFSPSFFEITVFMAFQYFLKNKVDVAVIEVGLGGRLDSTNIIKPVLSIITNIGKDHMEFLGDTLPRIAREKAGIIKPNVPVVIGESRDETSMVFREVADSLKSPILFADSHFSVGYSMTTEEAFQVFEVRKNNVPVYPGIRCELLGHYQKRNVVTVMAGIENLRESGFMIPDIAVYNGIARVAHNTGLYGRWQVIAENPKIICDTAHNAEGIQWVMDQVTEMRHRQLHILIGFVSDKNLDLIFEHLPSEAVYYFCRLSVPRTMDENKLRTLAKEHGFEGKAYASVGVAYESVMQQACKDDVILVTGSTFCVADLLSLVHQNR